MSYVNLTHPFECMFSLHHVRRILKYVCLFWSLLLNQACLYLSITWPGLYEHQLREQLSYTIKKYVNLSQEQSYIFVSMTQDGLPRTQILAMK